MLSSINFSIASLDIVFYTIIIAGDRFEICPQCPRNSPYSAI